MIPSLSFLVAAFFLAIAPGPGIAYVLARTVSGGRSEGIASSIGLGCGGLVHVAAGALGLSVLFAKSALAYSCVKYLGAGYLIYLGIKTLRTPIASLQVRAELKSSVYKAFRDGIVVEVLNVKTALFFLALIPQYISMQHALATQFFVLGSICVFLNTAVDLLVVVALNRFVVYETRAGSKARLLSRISGLVMLGLGVLVIVGSR